MSAVAGQILRDAGRPMHLADLIPLVQSRLSDLGVALSSSTPRASLGLALRFVKEIRAVGRGTYAWSSSAEP